MIEPFSWRDGERLIAFGRGLAERAVDLLGGPGYTLLTTERAAAAAPRIAEAAATVHHVPTGQVHEVAGEHTAAANGAGAPAGVRRA